MEYPRISVIVPIYNTEKYLNKCIESIINQTYKELEIILIDDGSSDSSADMCDNWAQKDKRIMVQHKPNGGLSDARNAGITLSTGEFIMFVDSDDFIDIHTIADLYKIQSSTNADVVCGGIYKYSNGNIRKVYNESIHQEIISFTGIEQVKNILNSKTDCGVWCKLYTRNVIHNHRFIKGRYNEDIIFLFSLYPKCSKVVYTNKQYYYYRDTAGSITHVLSEKTMHALQNALEMEETVLKNEMPILKDMENYKCRTCLELGYAIQRDNACSRFLQESNYIKKQVRKYLFYMLKHPDYNWKDLIHALIVLARL